MLAQQLLNGLISGAVYALFALGFTLMFGMLGVINLTYGFYFSVGAFLALFATVHAKLSVFVSLPLAAVATGVVAVAIDSLIITPLRKAKAPELSSLMVTLGATLLLYSLMTAWFGTDIRRFPASVFPDDAYEIGGVRIALPQIIVLATVALVVLGLGLLLRRTKIGLALRALAENPDAAELMGVNTNAMVRLVSFVSGGLGGAGGVLIGLNTNAIQPYMGEAMMLKGFAVIILGGLGDVRGALVAGFILGLLETMTAGYIASSLKDAVGFILLVLTLWVRPVGLFGRVAARRA